MTKKREYYWTPNVKWLYHATTIEKAKEILTDGEIKPKESHKVKGVDVSFWSPYEGNDFFGSVIFKYKAEVILSSKRFYQAGKHEGQIMTTKIILGANSNKSFEKNKSKKKDGYQFKLQNKYNRLHICLDESIKIKDCVSIHFVDHRKNYGNREVITSTVTTMRTLLPWIIEHKDFDNIKNIFQDRDIEWLYKSLAKKTEREFVGNLRLKKGVADWLILSAFRFLSENDEVRFEQIISLFKNHKKYKKHLHKKIKATWPKIP